MWYLIGMAVCLLVFILLPFIRFRNYFNQVLKEPNIKKVPVFTLLWNHILASISSLWNFGSWHIKVVKLANHNHCSD